MFSKLVENKFCTLNHEMTFFKYLLNQRSKSEEVGDRTVQVTIENELDHFNNPNYYPKKKEKALLWYKQVKSLEEYRERVYEKKWF